MTLMSEEKGEVYLKDPRFGMTFVGRGLVRVASYVGYLFLAAVAITFLFSGIDGLLYIGLLLVLFFLDYSIHFKRADKPLSDLPKKGVINLATFITPQTFLVLEKAFDRSVLKKTNFFLEAARQLVNFKSIKEGLERMDVKPEEFIQKIEELLILTEGQGEKELKEADLQILAKGAFEGALARRHKFILPVDLFSTLGSLEDEEVLRLFNLFDIEKGDLEKALVLSSLKEEFSRFRSLPSTLGGFVPGVHQRIRHRVMNRAWTSRPTPTLDKYSLDLTDLARTEQSGFLIGHAAEYLRLVEALARPYNPNALLIGEEGIGKEALVSHLAFNISKDQVPEALFDKRLVLLQISELVAGAKPEETQARLQKVVSEIVLAGNVILYLPEFHDLVRTSGTAYLSVADALVPIIKNNEFPLIGASYPREFKESIESRSDLLGLFEVIRVSEITKEEAEEVLVYESLLLEQEMKMVISFGAIKKAVYLAKKYFTNKFLPSSASDLLKNALVAVKQKDKKFLGPGDVVRAAEERINVPIHEASEEEAQQLLNLEDIIHERLVDQKEAVGAVADVLREYRSGLTKTGKPIASFLFVGPTGVGKTELAKILTKIIFGSKDLMVRFDMTEYQDKQSFYRFIGSPDGKISGSLTDAVLKKPFCVILLDEFEKAFPDILDLFLQVLDDGRLTDNLGRVVDFQNTIIIATSNAHSDIINKTLNSGEKMSNVAEYLKHKLADVFKPELLNRFSKIVVFNNLALEEVKKITLLNLNDFAALVREQGIFLEFDESTVSEIAKLGYDPAFGARPIERVINEKLKTLLAEKILKKEIKKGWKVKIFYENERFDFRIE